MNRHMLTTTDNPYNPFTQFNEWYVWDQKQGYNTLSYLGRVVITSDELSEADQNSAYEQAYDEIINANGGLYVKVSSPSNVVEEN